MKLLDKQDMQRLEDDFRSGRNPRAYIPLCHVLRRQRRFLQALEMCQQGLVQGGDSLAGHLMNVRLLGDLAHYDEMKQAIERAEPLYGDTLALLVEKVKCHLWLREYEEAAAIHKRLDARNPFDPRVSFLAQALREQRAGSSAWTSSEVKRQTFPFPQLDRMAASIRQQIEPLGKVFTIGIVDLDSNKTHVEGNPALVEAMENLFGETAIACDELGQGDLIHSMIELEGAIVLIVRRERRLVVLSVDPDMNFGKFQHRVYLVLQQYLPARETGEITTEADPYVL